ncbi:MAG: wax ester/triacylglycerol synthase family O-acyltransferase [Mycobacteriaceae bacterium]|nr:wax ester/triacylglycerol synthase family O-acyltransferase [Mycobacteriaceae bacterium]
MKRLSGVDAMLLYSETPQIHTHTLKVGLLDVSNIRGGYSFEKFRNRAAPRLLGLAPLRYQLVGIPLKFHHPMWRENASIDPSYHVRRIDVPAPGGRRELDQVIGIIAGCPLSRDRPLWQMYVAEGVAGGRVAVIWKVHHALADGIASANMIAKALRSPDSLVQEGLAARPDVVPSNRHLLEAALRDHLKQLAALPKLIWNSGEGIVRVWQQARKRQADAQLRRPIAPPKSFINHVVSPGRLFATAPLPLADVKQTSKALGVTINDLVLAMAAGALRKLLLHYDGRADSPLVAGVPVSFDRSVDRLNGNEIGYVTPPLLVNIEDRLDRVRMTAQATAIAKENFHLRGPTLMASWLNYLPPPLAPAMFRWQSRRWTSGMAMNLTISNVPGPRQISSFDGATITEIYSVGPLAAGSALNITVWSYADQLAISVLTDDVTVDDPHEVTDAMTQEFAEIRLAVGLSTAIAPIRSTLPTARPARAATT